MYLNKAYFTPNFDLAWDGTDDLDLPDDLELPRDGPDDHRDHLQQLPGRHPRRDELTGIEFLGAFKVIWAIPRPNFVQFLTDLKLLQKKKKLLLGL